MRKLLAIAAFMLASTAAQAQYSFEYGGRTIRIDPDRGTVSIPGVYDNTGRRSKRARDQDNDKSRKQAPQDAKADPQTPSSVPAPADQAVTPPAPAIPPLPEPPATTANNAPADTAVQPPPLPPIPAPVAAPPLQQDAAPVPKPVPAPTVAAVPPPAAAVLPPPAAIRDPNSPLGVWLTEEKEGKVRIEQCGANLCGYSVDAKSNKNGEQVLINMKPSKDQKWSGRILDPNTGSTYDSTIALKGTDTLRVQGCAFGGMFCGGQTWTRVY
jgi:uncharacterized protein (DUF2147 family)